MSRRSPQSPADEVRRKSRQLFARRVLLAALCAPVLIFLAVFLWVASTGAADRVSREAYLSGDVSRIAREASGDAQPEALSPRSQAVADPFETGLTPSEIAAIELEKPPAALDSAAAKWVAFVNRTNPSAILHYETSEFGNLHIIPGLWVYDRPADEVHLALDTFGRYWRSYLHEAFGPWNSGDTTERFEPGIVFYDAHGEFGRNLGGYVRLLRLPQLPSADTL